MNYQARLREHLIEYKQFVLGIAEPGIFRYRGRDIPKAHILPTKHRSANLLDRARPLVDAHLAANPSVRPHRYFHHLNSSQAFAFNLFFPFFDGGSKASAALLRALGQNPPLRSWEPEAVPDKDEGTNLDARWTLSDGTAVMCEVKLSEADFGKARPDEEHRHKLKQTYRQRLLGQVDDEMLKERSFFRAYQVLRNVWHMIGTSGSLLVFLIPRENKRLWEELMPTLDSLAPAARRRVTVVAIEDVLTSLQNDGECPDALRGYAQQLERKYVVGSA